MAPRTSVRVALVALLALAGCDLGATDPVSLQLSFQSNHTRNADGTCTVRYAALASGFGTAEWDRVTIERSGTVIEEYVGAETAQFWGAASISAGQAQNSVPFQAPNGGEGTTVEVAYDITGPRTVPLNVVCPAA